MKKGDNKQYLFDTPPPPPPRRVTVNNKRLISQRKYMHIYIWIYSVCPLVFDFSAYVIQFILMVFRNFADTILSPAFLALYGLRLCHTFLDCINQWIFNARNPYAHFACVDVCKSTFHVQNMCKAGNLAGNPCMRNPQSASVSLSMHLVSIYEHLDLQCLPIQLLLCLTLYGLSNSL